MDRSQANQRRGARPGQVEQTTGQDNAAFVRSIFRRWEQGGTDVEWADPDIDFCGPECRAGRGVELMTKLWNDWLETMDEFDVVPDRFVDAGDDEVLVPARFICGRRGKSGGNVRLGVMLFKLRGGKVGRLSVFIDQEQGPKRRRSR